MDDPVVGDGVGRRDAGLVNGHLGAVGVDDDRVAGQRVELAAREVANPQGAGDHVVPQQVGERRRIGTEQGEHVGRQRVEGSVGRGEQRARISHRVGELGVESGLTDQDEQQAELRIGSEHFGDRGEGRRDEGRGGLGRHQRGVRGSVGRRAPGHRRGRPDDRRPVDPARPVERDRPHTGHVVRGVDRHLRIAERRRARERAVLAGERRRDAGEAVVGEALGYGVLEVGLDAADVDRGTDHERSESGDDPGDEDAPTLPGRVRADRCRHGVRHHLS